jgi:hypothetical protein
MAFLCPSRAHLLGMPQKVLSQQGLHLIKFSLPPHSLPALVQMHSLLQLIVDFEGLDIVASRMTSLSHAKLCIFGLTVSLSLPVL